ncbi:DUF721 domain-containing protein [Streptomyces sp. NPDC020875]|uniref:DUF721 domain-containing protein n=1 Tax=Streptomyces sp. NPDC020875 TaxID=3154898 RepID=UPI0033F18B8E
MRRDGREPVGLGAALGALVTDRAWELPAAGASLREWWAAIAPELTGHVAAVAYDPDSGRLTVCPESSAWATKARLEQTRVIAAANQAAGRTVVKFLRILPPGAAPVPLGLNLSTRLTALEDSPAVACARTVPARFRRRMDALDRWGRSRACRRAVQGLRSRARGGMPSRLR